MSCRSTPLASAATSAACASEPTLTPSQVQSLFHALKREGASHGAPTPEEVKEGIDQLRFRITRDTRLKPFMKERLLKKLNESTASLDGPTWFAIRSLASQTTVARMKLERIYKDVAEGLGIDVVQVRQSAEQWRDSEVNSFEDIHTEDERFRYDLTPGVPRDERTQRALRKLGYEHFLAQPYPIFVYGTLRPGQHNHDLLYGAVDHYEPAHINNVGMYRSSYSFPYAQEREGAQTVGEVIWVTNNERGSQARQHLDALEGFNSDWPSTSHYERVLSPVQIQGSEGGTEELLAWVYLARSAGPFTDAEHIRHGDWIAAKRGL